MTKHGEATETMPQAAQGESAPDKAPQITPTTPTPDQRVFVSMAVSMSWQLALVVLVPIIGGHVLDEHYHKMPLLTLCGLAVAAIGVFGVLYRTVSESKA